MILARSHISSSSNLWRSMAVGMLLLQGRSWLPPRRPDHTKTKQNRWCLEQRKTCVKRLRTSAETSTLVLRFLVFAVVRGLHARLIKISESDAVPQLFVCWRGSCCCGGSWVEGWVLRLLVCFISGGMARQRLCVTKMTKVCKAVVNFH